MPYKDPEKARQAKAEAARRKRAAIREDPEAYAEWSARNRERVAAWQAAHPERTAEIKRESYERHRERYAEEFAQRYAADPAPYKQKAREREKGAKLAGSYTTAEWEELCDRHGRVCLCCGRPRPLTVDHVVPLSKGGSNTIDNLQPLCQECNDRKGIKTTDYR